MASEKVEQEHGLKQTLDGVRVLDLSQYLPGPYATQILADLGADVLKVEPPSGDPMRTFMSVDSDGVSPWYKQINAGKRVVEIDLKSADGQALVAELVSAADILLESYRPGVLERLNFSRAKLEILNPGLIHCTLSGFGQNGPCRDRAGHDLTYLAMSGMLSLSGTAETPVMPFPPICDYATGKQAATCILAGLLRKQRTGKGAYIDVSLFEMALSWQSLPFVKSGKASEKLVRGRALLNGGAACYQLYRTSDDRFVALGAIEEKFWRLFCSTVNRPEWIDRQNDELPQTVLISEVQQMFAGADFDYWCETFTGVDCCFEPVLNHDEVARHPHVQNRRLVDIAPSGRVDALFPVWFDDQAPPSRQSMQLISADEALYSWVSR